MVDKDIRKSNMSIRYFRSACSYGTDGFVNKPKPYPFIVYKLEANIFKNIFIDISSLLNKSKNIFSYLGRGNDFSFGRDLILRLYKDKYLYLLQPQDNI